MSKFTEKEKLHAVMRRIKNKESFIRIANSIGADESSVREWCRNYEAFGEQAFSRQNNAHYSLQFKEDCVKYYLAGKGSLYDTCKRFKIPGTYTLRSWISMYNSHELKASPGGKGIMTKGRTTTLEERVTIVEACIKSGMNYEKTAELFEVSYQQIYQWVHKYQEKGVKGLEDRRGKAKPVSEMTESEKLRAENKLLRAQLERKELENLFLKKLEEIERRQS